MPRGTVTLVWQWLCSICLTNRREFTAAVKGLRSTCGKMPEGMQKREAGEIQVCKPSLSWKYGTLFWFTRGVCLPWKFRCFICQSHWIKELITETKPGMQMFLLPGDRLLCVCARSLSVCRMDLWCSLQGVSVSTGEIKSFPLSMNRSAGDRTPSWRNGGRNPGKN